MRHLALVVVLAALALGGCPGPKRPTPLVQSVVLEIGRADGSLRGVAGDGTTTFAAVTTGAATVIEARRGSAIAWSRPLAGGGGPLAFGHSTVAVTLAGSGTVADVAMRGDPGAVAVALDAATGAPRWTLAIDSSEWSLISSIAPTTDGFLVGGSFSGTLRATSKIVSSAGKSDGFVALIKATGEVVWLVRMGGANSDAVQGVAALGDRIVVAGSFGPGAEILGEPLASYDDKTPKTDVFVTELTRAGTRVWASHFGGALDDAVAGIAIDGKGRIAVASTAREKLRINLADITAQGPADGLVTYFAKDGTPGPTVVLAGPDFDGIRAITATADRMVVAGFYTGSVVVGRQPLTSTGGDDAYLAALDGGTVTKVWPIAGAGREEITALAPIPGGFIAGLAHTATASIDGTALPAPAEPLSGAALIVRPDR
ncbi:MAG: hypothetical protein ABI867_13495 [Kofleriaceae bacterium]